MNALTLEEANNLQEQVPTIEQETTNYDATQSEPTDDHNPTAPIQGHVQGESECSQCFCAPCVVDNKNRQSWWPMQDALPSTRNVQFWHFLYKRFWAAMKNRHAFEDQRYKDRKVDILRNDPRMRHYLWHRQDIMP